MTLTPIDFTVITRFHYVRASVEFSSELVEDGLSVRSLLRFPLVLEKYEVVSIFNLIKQVFGSSKSDHVLIPEKMAQVIILIILAGNLSLR